MTADPAFNPVLLDIPDCFETERLALRAPRSGDGAILNASVIETLDDLRRNTGEHAGNCGLHRFNRNTRVIEIGWWCRKRFQGQGLITEAAAAITEFVFRHLGARRVWCCADEGNERSWRVAERLGFDHEGTLRSERCDPDGTRRTMRVYATTR